MAYIAKEMTQKFEEASHPLFYGAEPSSKGDQAEHTLSEYEPNKNPLLFELFFFSVYTRMCTNAAVFDWFDRYTGNREACRRKGPELATEDLANLTH